MKTTVEVSSPVPRTGRVIQLSGMFDLPPTVETRKVWDVDLPIEDRPWNVGLIVGPSGCGKSRIANAVFNHAMVEPYIWGDGSVVDAFPSAMGIKDIVSVLSSVGFSSPPSWLVPFHVLSNGEQFRANLARTLVDERPVVVVDEFTSVVDRTVAKVASHAMQRAVRERNRKFVAVSCHHDIVEWLNPDWVFSPAGMTFEWRGLQRRPRIDLEVRRADVSSWRFFKDHHYLTGDIHPAVHCFIAFVEGRLAAFSASMHFPSPKKGKAVRHLSRTVCLPDFQGVGIGNTLAEYVASLWKAVFWDVRATAGHPAIVKHRAKSNLWRMVRAPGRMGVMTRSSDTTGRTSLDRITATFEYVGAAASVSDVELFEMGKHRRAL